RGRGAEDRVPGDLSERDDDAEARQRGELAGEERPAACELVGRRLVGGRRAAGGERDEDVADGEAVFAVDRRRLVGEAGAVERAEEEGAARIAGEDAAGARAAVRRRREPDERDARRRVAPARKRPRVVAPRGELAFLLLRDAGEVRDEARAGAAGEDLVGENGQAAQGGPSLARSGRVSATIEG